MVRVREETHVQLTRRKHYEWDLDYFAKLVGVRIPAFRTGETGILVRQQDDGNLINLWFTDIMDPERD